MLLSKDGPFVAFVVVVSRRSKSYRAGWRALRRSLSLAAMLKYRGAFYFLVAGPVPGKTSPGAVDLASSSRPRRSPDREPRLADVRSYGRTSSDPASDPMEDRHAEHLALRDSARAALTAGRSGRRPPHQ